MYNAKIVEGVCQDQGQVTRGAAWPHSSFHRYVERGIYDLDWAADDSVRSLEME
jgi:putative transposase